MYMLKSQQMPELLDLIQLDPRNIQFIDNPSEDIQLVAVNQNGLLIRFIKNPSENVQISAVKQNGFSLMYIKDPNIELCKLAKTIQKPITKDKLIELIDRRSKTKTNKSPFKL